MCGPAAIPIMMAATAAMSMAGQFVQGQAAYTQAKYQQAADVTNMHLAEDQARNSIDNTKREAQLRYRQAAQLEGNQQAAMAANGVDLNFGTPVDVLKDDKMIASEDVGNIYSQGNQKVRGFLIDAYNYNMDAKAKASAAKSQGWATAFGMAGTALGAASQIGKYKAGSGG